MSLCTCLIIWYICTAKMIPLFMMFAGGPLGSGMQWYWNSAPSWKSYWATPVSSGISCSMFQRKFFIVIKMSWSIISLQWWVNVLYRYSCLCSLDSPWFSFWKMSRFSWIHLDDIVSLIYEALSNSSYKGTMALKWNAKSCDSWENEENEMDLWSLNILCVWLFSWSDVSIFLKISFRSYQWDSTKPC